MTELEKTILKTVAYYDLLDYPLTAVEIWRWLYNPGQPVDLVTIDQLLKESSILKEMLSQVEGFYCLKNREDLIPLRKQRNLDADKQMRKAVKFARLFRLIPSVKLIAVCSSLASGNVKTTSDIDLFIVCQKGTIWQTRFMLVALLKLLNQRPSPQATKDKICLSYYVTEEALDLASAQVGHDDIVFTYYVDGFLPIYDNSETRKDLFKANQWVYEKLPNSQWENSSTLLLEPGIILRSWHKLFEVLNKAVFNTVTRDWVTNLQLKIMPENLKARANVDTRVVVSDRVLKFHDKDNREELRQRWINKVNELVEEN